MFNYKKQQITYSFPSTQHTGDREDQYLDKYMQTQLGAWRPRKTLDFVYCGLTLIGPQGSIQIEKTEKKKKKKVIAPVDW